VPRPTFPKTLPEFQSQFSTEEDCQKYLASCRWPDGFLCPRCGNQSRLKARLGAPKAIVAMAHHLARLVYRMLRYGQNYVEQGIHQYELKFQLQRIKWLRKEAKWLNLQLVPA
jgi:Transposase zinc-ribbon domain